MNPGRAGVASAAASARLVRGGGSTGVPCTGASESCRGTGGGMGVGTWGPGFTRAPEGARSFTETVSSRPSGNTT